MIVKIPEDVYKYENKVWGNFSGRMLIFILAALAIIFVVFAAIFWPTGSIDLAGGVSTTCGLIVMWFGIYSKDGQHLERILKYKYQAKHKYLQKRKFSMKNLYEIIQGNQKEWRNANDQLERLEKEASEESKKANGKKISALGKKRHCSK
ncbi:PrgI family protein [Faecalispora sporosphaeroides]|uniref:PrgI family protein n=1 Tax=Faecalispora sporosphaeroides TaxID=1549 RepID=UPI00037CDAA0|nr:PrgI family protein [Faecalispora sporosphaeroides]